MYVCVCVCVCVCVPNNITTGDVVTQPRRLQVLQDKSEVGQAATDRGQVCQSSRTEGNLRHHLQTRGQ